MTAIAPDDFVAGAFHVLRPRGAMYLVVNRLLSLTREVERVFGGVETVARSKGYVVIRAVKQPIVHGEFEADDEAPVATPAARARR